MIARLKYLLPAHIVGCLLFLSLPVLFSAYPLNSADAYTMSLVMKDLLLYSLLVGFFYSNYFFLIDRLYFTKKYPIYIAILIGIYFSLLIIPHIFHSFYLSHKGLENTSNDKYVWLLDIRRILILFIGILFASLAIKINGKWKQEQKEKLNAELISLKSQINPHFLFNTLNSIYSLALIKSDKTPNAIVKLSAMMRYAITETVDRFVPLESEIGYINSYIELQRMRLDDTAIINYSCEGDPKEKVVAPLVLIPFIENAFKHGVNPEARSQIDIQISITEHNLYMSVFNLKVPHITNKEARSGYGIKNGRRQLDLLYPKKHFLKIENKEHTFTVELKLQLL